MKADAPEKIYLIRNFPTSTSLNTTNDYRGKYLQEWYKSREKDADIEYTRTDVFIDKVCKWLEENAGSYLFYPFCEYDKGALLEDFRKAMEDNL